MSDGTGSPKSTARWKMFPCGHIDERARSSVRRSESAPPAAGAGLLAGTGLTRADARRLVMAEICRHSSWPGQHRASRPGRARSRRSPSTRSCRIANPTAWSRPAGPSNGCVYRVRTRRASSVRCWTGAPGAFRIGPYDEVGAGSPPLPAGQPGARDHLADPDRMAARPRCACAWVRGTTSTSGRRTHRRSPTDFDAEHCLLRTVRCVSGSVDVAMSCEPALDYGRRQPQWGYEGAGLRRSSCATEGLDVDACGDHRPACRYRGAPACARGRA